jgi:hypothetical protein
MSVCVSIVPVCCYYSQSHAMGTLHYVTGALLYDVRNLSDIRHDAEMIAETLINVGVELMGTGPHTNLLAGHLTTHAPTARLWFYWQKGVQGESMLVAQCTV